MPALALARPYVAHPRIGAHLAAMLEAQAHGDNAEFARQAQNGRAVFAGGRLEVQLHLRPGVQPETLTDAQLRSFDALPGARGIDLMDVWLPLVRIGAFLDAHPEVAFAQLPWRGVPLTGKVQSEGATLLHTPETVCLAADGTGTTVAVVDSNYQHWQASIDAGELPHVVGTTSEIAGPHGTMCAEVIADTAPGAAIVPITAGSLAALQAFIKTLTNGNPKKIDIVSHSVGWFGMSFGRHEGPLCALTDLAHAAGVAWVNAAGNNGGGLFYTAPFQDADKDGCQDVEPGKKRLTFSHYGGPISIMLDWDDYAHRTQNLDLALQRQQDDGSWLEVTASRSVQGPYTPPVESVQLDPAVAGRYALVIEAKSGVVDGVRLRVVNLGGGSGTFSVWNSSGNVYDPASCNDVLTVGAVYQEHYAAGPIESYSSYGPTVDGRQKPEVVAPTGVSTSMGAFFGTSAACPHAAGVLAIYAAATGKSALSLMDMVRNDAIAMGESFPDEIYGWGRAQLRPSSLGWQCAADLPGDATCLTACGSIGQHACQKGCIWSKCLAPSETCNGKDDNCDGVTDEGCAQPKPDVLTDLSAPDATPVETTPLVASKSAQQDSGCQASPQPSSSWSLMLFAIAALLTARAGPRAGWRSRGGQPHKLP